jgi:quinol monooxygenase YgiN
VDKKTTRVGLLVRVEARAGKEEEVAGFLAGALPLAEEEPGTTTWYAIRIGPSTFGVFDTFPDDEARQAHLTGRIASALMAKAGELLSQPPSIERIDVLAAKLPR